MHKVGNVDNKGLGRGYEKQIQQKNIYIRWKMRDI